jgi:hypothetical protein
VSSGARRRSCAAAAGLAAAIRRRPWRCGGAARVGGPRSVRAGRQAASGLSWAGCLVPFGAVPGPRCSAFSLPLTVLAAPCVAGFLGSRWTCRLGLLGIYSRRMTQQVLEGACPCRCVARERRPDTTLPFIGCSSSLTGSFLTAFSRAARRGGRTPMMLSCRAPPKYPGCVVEPQADGRGSLGVSRRLPFRGCFLGSLCELDWHSSHHALNAEVLLLLSVAAHGLEHTEQALSSKS